MNDEFEDGIDEFDTVTMEDENGDEIEFVIIDRKEFKGVNYLLVIESAYIDDEEAEAVLLRESASDEEISTYELVEDDEEFNRVAGLFQTSGGDDYDIQLS